MGVFSKSVTLRICSARERLAARLSRFRTMATSEINTAIQIWVFTAFPLAL